MPIKIPFTLEEAVLLLNIIIRGREWELSTSEMSIWASEILKNMRLQEILIQMMILDRQWD